MSEQKHVVKEESSRKFFLRAHFIALTAPKNTHKTLSPKQNKETHSLARTLGLQTLDGFNEILVGRHDGDVGGGCLVGVAKTLSLEEQEKKK